MNKRIRPGQLVFWRNDGAIVLEVKGFSELIIRVISTEKIEVANISDVAIRQSGEDYSTQKHVLAKDKDWDTAVKRFEIITPLLENPSRCLEDVKRVSEESLISTATIYRWISKFEETGLVSSLLRTPRSDKGKGRISKEVDEVIDLMISEHYLKPERLSVLKLYRLIREECHSLELDAPDKNTVYSRVEAINSRELVTKRFSAKKAREKFEPLRGNFPGADFPNAVIQIDHTKVDLIVVDEVHRLPIGRAFLTLAIDVTTKMVTGFCITLDPPSALSAGLCIAHAVGRKEHWLAKRDIFAEWPIYGKMRKIHMDNAKEFRGNMLNRATEEHGILTEFRPKGQPNYGPHIERAFRTFMKECQSLPGTTFSNVQAKAEYDSEGNACMTINEFEAWFTVFIVYCYHHRAHKGICDVPPIKLYQKYIFGSDTQPGIGLPEPILDEEKFKLDFTPYVERTIQRDGVTINNIQYYSPVLRQWIDAADPMDKSKARKFIFARDPRDISTVYFLDPITKSYVPVPYFDATRPAMSLWELQAVIRKIKEDPDLEVDEETIFKGLKKMREIEVAAIEKTRLSKQQRATEKRKRRMKERRSGWSDIHKSTKMQPAIDPIFPESDEENEDIAPFNDIQVG